MPSLFHLQKALIYFKAVSRHQYVLGVKRLYWEISSCPFQLPCLPVVWVGQSVAEVQHNSASVLSPVKLDKACFLSFCIQGIALPGSRPNSALHSAAMNSE